MRWAISPDVARQCFFQTTLMGKGKTTVMEFCCAGASIPRGLKTVNGILRHIQAAFDATPPLLP